MNIELYIMKTVPIFSCGVPEPEFINQYTPRIRKPMPIPKETFQAFLNLRKFISQITPEFSRIQVPHK